MILDDFMNIFHGVFEVIKAKEGPQMVKKLVIWILKKYEKTELNHM